MSDFMIKISWEANKDIIANIAYMANTWIVLNQNLIWYQNNLFQ